MTNLPIEVRIDKDLEELIPEFLANRHKELDALREALAAMNFATSRQLGHRMKGVGNSFGFKQISILGKEIDDAARTRNNHSLETLLSAYGYYLATLRVTYA